MRRYNALTAHAAIAVVEPTDPEITAAGPPELAVLPAPVPAPPPAPSVGIKKLSLAGIGKKKEEGKTEYPILPDPEGKAAELAARIAERQDQFDALKSALETDKAELGRIYVRPWYLSWAVAAMTEVGAGRNRMKKLPMSFPG